MSGRFISSSSTWFHTRVFPRVAVGFVLLMLICGVATAMLGGLGQPILLVLFGVPLFLGGVMFFLFRTLLADLVDEVEDGGDALIVRRRGVEARIPLGEIIDVSYKGTTRPPRVTLTVREATALGKQVVFIPVTVITGLVRHPTKHPTVDDLRARIDKARQSGAGGGTGA